MSSAYVAFRSSERLRANSRLLLKNLESRSTEPQSVVMNAIMADFTDELLQAYMIDIIDIMQLSPFMNKFIHGTVSTIKTTVSSVSKPIINKLSNKQLVPLGDYIRDIMLTAPHPERGEQPWVGFSLDAAFHARVEALISKLREPNPTAHTTELVEILSKITDRAMEVYIVAPTELLGLGFITRKVADTGSTVIRSASQALIRKLIPDLGEAQLVALANYMDELLLRNGRPEAPKA